MQVVEQEHQRLGVGERLQELADRAVHPVAVGLRRRCAGAVGERREHLAELVARVVDQLPQAPRLERVEVVVERVDEDRERQLALELRGAAGEHELPAPVGALGQLREHARLADAGLAHQLQGARPPPLELGEGLVEHL